MSNAANWFQEDNDEYLKFDRVTKKLSSRPDIHAFILLDNLFPRPGKRFISSATHDQFWLDVEPEEIERLTQEQVTELTRCGVVYDNSEECLYMFP